MPELPHKIAVLCYLFDADGRVLLLHRRKPPNQDLYSPIGGKLETSLGESPTACAVREISEEVGLKVTAKDLHLTGIISEEAFQDECHWLMFLYELVKPVEVSCIEFDEGRLEWHDADSLNHLPIPATDRSVIWPLFWKYRGRFFTAHICCAGGRMEAVIEQPREESGPLRCV
mgnify:CR=1 FL=1